MVSEVHRCVWYKLLASLKGGLPMARDDLDFSVHVDFHSMGIYRHVGSDVILGFGAMEMGTPNMGLLHRIYIEYT